MVNTILDNYVRKAGGRTRVRACVLVRVYAWQICMWCVRTQLRWLVIWTRSADVDVGLCIAAAGSKCEYPILAQFGFQPSTKQNVLMLTHIGLVVCKMFYKISPIDDSIIF